MRTLLLIKPGAAARHDIVDGIMRAVVNDRLMVIHAIRFFTFTPEKAEEFYSPHKGKEFYEKLVKYMTSGQVIALEICGSDVVNKVRTLCGATDPEKAEEGTLRRRFGKDITRNAVHSSDTQKAAERELRIVFGK